MKLVTLLLAVALTAGCGPRPVANTDQAAAKSSAKPPRRCPDPDIRDTKDPCSVAYIQRSAPRKPNRDGF